MSSVRGYHDCVRRSVSAPVALFGLMVMAAIFAVGAWAQTNNASSHATSSGGASHAVSAAAAAPVIHVPSPPHTGHGSGGSGSGGGNHGGTPSHSGAGPGQGDRNRYHSVEYAPPVIYAVPVPYAVDIADTDDYSDGDVDANDPDYQGGPTVFDRRGLGEESYVPPVSDDDQSYLTRSDDREAEPEPQPEPTILIFKDGHKLEVANYAIVGPTFFDLTPGHARRIALADLDLAATYKQNDERGVIFQLPAAVQAN